MTQCIHRNWIQPLPYFIQSVYTVENCRDRMNSPSASQLACLTSSSAGEHEECIVQKKHSAAAAPQQNKAAQILN